MPVTGSSAAAARKKVRCPKCTALLTEPPTPIYECPICSTLLLAKSSSDAPTHDNYSASHRDTNQSSKLGKAMVIQKGLNHDSETIEGLNGAPRSKNALDGTLIQKVKLLPLDFPDFPAQNRLSHSSVGSAESPEESYREAYFSRADSSSSTGSDPDANSPPWLPGGHHANIGLQPASVLSDKSEGVKGTSDKLGGSESPGSDSTSLENHEAAQSIPFYYDQNRRRNDWSQEGGSPRLEVDLEIDDNTYANEMVFKFALQHDEADEVSGGDSAKDWSPSNTSSTRGSETFRKGMYGVAALGYTDVWSEKVVKGKVLSSVDASLWDWKSSEGKESPKAKDMDADPVDKRRMLHLDVAAGSGNKNQSTSIPYRSPAMQRLLQDGEPQKTANAPDHHEAQYNLYDSSFPRSNEHGYDQAPTTGRRNGRATKTSADVVHRKAGSGDEEEIATGVMQLSFVKDGDYRKETLYVGAQHNLPNNLALQEDTPSAYVSTISTQVVRPRAFNQPERTRVSLINQIQVTEEPQPRPLYSNGQNVALLPNSMVYPTQLPPHNLQEQDPPHDHIPALPGFLGAPPQPHRQVPKASPTFVAHSSRPVESHLHSLSDANRPMGEWQPRLIVPEQMNTNVVHHQQTARRRLKCYPPLPREGALPFVLCPDCKHLLRVPTHLPLLYGTAQKLRCGSCRIVSKFSLPQNANSYPSSMGSCNLSGGSVVPSAASPVTPPLRRSPGATNYGSSQTHQYEKADCMLPRNIDVQSVGGGRRIGKDSLAHANEHCEHDDQGCRDRAPHLRSSLYANEALVAGDGPTCESGSREETTSDSDFSRTTSQSSASQLARSPVDPRSRQQRRSVQGSRDGSRSAPWSPAPGSPLYDSRKDGGSSDLDERSYEGERKRPGGGRAPDASSKGPKYYAGLLKRGLREIGKGGHGNNDRQRVLVNGHLIPDAAVREAELQAGTVYPGHYWYDYQAGFWGVMGGPCLGINPPFIEEFNLPLARDCAGGRTGVLVNGRELHRKDLEVLAKRGLPTTAGKAYIVDITGQVVDEASGQQLKSLGRLAPSIERNGRGNGMFYPARLQP